jgi:hypothetical protein
MNTMRSSTLSARSSGRGSGAVRPAFRRTIVAPRAFFSAEGAKERESGSKGTPVSRTRHVPIARHFIRFPAPPSLQPPTAQP